MLEREIEKRLTNVHWDKKISQVVQAKIREKRHKKQILGMLSLLLVITTSYFSPLPIQKKVIDVVSFSSDYSITNSLLNEIGITTEYEDWVFQSSFLP
ncbi:MAG: hypothetical protein AAF518_10390 [Spirochaetota bacterium]